MTPELTTLLELSKAVTDAVLGVMGVIGIPVAVWLFYRERRKERRLAEYQAFDALDNKYTEFLALCLEHPELGVAPVRLPPGNSSSLSVRQRHLLFLVLLSILERAFLMYSTQHSEVRRRQWQGWIDFMRELTEQPAFLEAWHTHKGQFDSTFIAFGESLDPRLAPGGATSLASDPVIESSLEVRTTSTGPGVFATKRLAAGTVLAELRGTVRPLPTQHSLQVKPGVHIDSSGALDDFLNHSCDANASFDFSRFVFIARRDIRAGDEVCINYCATEYDLHSPFLCACGSDNCYGSVAGYRALTHVQRAAVEPYASPFLRELAAADEPHGRVGANGDLT